jgi:phosphoribosylglycinamide formyltransferase-1
MINIAVFASGSGTNTEKIIEQFKNHEEICISLIVCNKPDAYVLTRAENHQIPRYLISKDSFSNEEATLSALKNHSIDCIVLAGFLWLIPAYLVKAYPYRILNIHPALLPKYGGKGMYGMHVHRAVVENKEKESGISIHYVNEKYDEGQVIAQFSCQVDPADTAEMLAKKIHELEHAHFPGVIEKVAKGL